ncbi:hypothetical protein EI94DRAFT_160928 [Lactarius quietus]|nr:hypothetical protein EI94DRAFT_160928 [Lactarius quietus]
MSDSTPPKPKPGSLRDRIAAFEQKPASAPTPPAPRPKPGGLSQWKPRTSSPPDSPQPSNRHDNSMSATDAKESITKGGSLKERMAALQGLGAFGGGPATSPPPKPSEKPKWKPPPQVAVVAPVTGDDEEDVSAPDEADTSSKPVVSPLKTPSEEILAVLSKSPPPVNEEDPVAVSDVPTAGEEEADPEEEEKQRRAAIAARMARLGGARVGMALPIFGFKPEVKPKPVALAAEKVKEELPIADVPAGESDLKTDRDEVEAEAAENGAHICAYSQQFVYLLRVSCSSTLYFRHNCCYLSTTRERFLGYVPPLAPSARANTDSDIIVSRIYLSATQPWFEPQYSTSRDASPTRPASCRSTTQEGYAEANHSRD